MEKGWEDREASQRKWMLDYNTSKPILACTEEVTTERKGMRGFEIYFCRSTGFIERMRMEKIK